MAWQPTLPLTTTKIKEGPSIFLGNFEAIENWIETEHYGFTSSLSGKHKPGECAIIAIVASAEREALTDVPCAIAYDTQWTSFFYNDGVQWNNIGGAIESGTKMLFYQDTAPLGWTIVEEYDRLVYVTKGSEAGGEVGGTACSSGTWVITSVSLSGHILTIAEMPSHSHTYLQYSTAAWTEVSVYYQPLNPDGFTNYNMADAGGGAAHSHVVDHAGDWRPASYSCIICDKD